MEDRVRATLRERSNDVQVDGRAAQAPGTASPRLDPMDAPERVERRRGSRRSVAIAAVGIAAGSAIVVATATTLAPDGDTADRAAVTATSPSTTAVPFDCGTALPIALRVPSATRGPIDGPAPGAPPASEGQLVTHWLRADGPVELRWPASPPLPFGPKTSSASVVDAMTASSPDHMEIDVMRTPAPGEMATWTGADVVVDRVPAPVATPPLQCDVMQLTIVTTDGQWLAGLRVTPPEQGMPVETVDLQPTVVERRAVDTAPDVAVRCEGDGRSARPPNRSRGPEPSVRGDEPVDVLTQYIARTPGTARSGYIEMTEPDGSITYASDSGRGWSVLVFVGRDAAGGWSLQGSNTSGC
ncbi:MAG TPA: hypothetical protein VF230_02135 [Acidimicrobiales bacterium]